MSGTIAHVWEFCDISDNYSILTQTRQVNLAEPLSSTKERLYRQKCILYFKLSPCSECCIISVVWFPGVRSRGITKRKNATEV